MGGSHPPDSRQPGSVWDEVSGTLRICTWTLRSWFHGTSRSLASLGKTSFWNSLNVQALQSHCWKWAARFNLFPGASSGFLTMCCSHVFMVFFVWFPACYICYPLSAATLVCFEVRYELSACWSAECFHQLWSFGPPTCTASGCLRWQSVCASASSFFFSLQSDPSEISASFSYGGNWHRRRQTEPGAH